MNGRATAKTRAEMRVPRRRATTHPSSPATRAGPVATRTAIRRQGPGMPGWRCRGRRLPRAHQLHDLARPSSEVHRKLAALPAARNQVPASALRMHSVVREGRQQRIELPSRVHPEAGSVAMTRRDGGNGSENAHKGIAIIGHEDCEAVLSQDALYFGNDTERVRREGQHSEAEHQVEAFVAKRQAGPIRQSE